MTEPMIFDLTRQALWVCVVISAPLLTVALVVAASPKRAWRWSKRAYLAWRGWHVVRNSLLAASRPRPAGSTPGVQRTA